MGTSSSTGPDRYPSMIHRRIVRTHAWCPTALRLWRVKALHGTQRSFPKMPFDMKLVTEGGSDVRLLNVNCQIFFRDTTVSAAYALIGRSETESRLHGRSTGTKHLCFGTFAALSFMYAFSDLHTMSTMEYRCVDLRSCSRYACRSLVITERLFAWVSRSSWRTPRQLS